MNKQEFISRRQALLEKMAPASAAVFFSAPPAQRNADSEYPYRQHSDFLYLTGFSEPEAVLVLIKSDETHNHSVLFNQVRDLTAEIWFGRRLGQDAAPEKLGIDRALPFDEINEQLCQLLNGLDTLYFAQGEMAYADTIVFNALDTLRRGSRRNLSAPARLLTGGRLSTKCVCLNPRRSWTSCAVPESQCTGTHPRDGKMPSRYVRIPVTGRN